MSHNMKKFLIILLFTPFFLFAQEDYTNRKTALVIGNSAYKNAPLRNPKNDAIAMSATLKDLGFEVLSYTDISRAEMRQAIQDFGDILSDKKGLGLFYYAGHGLQYQGKNYLVPVDAEIERSFQIEDECIKADQVLKMMELYKNPMNIVIMDACRNNPYTRSFRDMNQGLAKPDNAPVGSFIAFATAPGSVASDGEGENGLYTQELIKAMMIPNLTLEQVFKEVRNNVLAATNNKQIPWENSSLRGDFYFHSNPGNVIEMNRKPVLSTESNKNKYDIFDGVVKKIVNNVPVLLAMLKGRTNEQPLEQPNNLVIEAPSGVKTIRMKLADNKEEIQTHYSRSGQVIMQERLKNQFLLERIEFIYNAENELNEINQTLLVGSKKPDDIITLLRYNGDSSLTNYGEFRYKNIRIKFGPGAVMNYGWNDFEWVGGFKHWASDPISDDDIYISYSENGIDESNDSLMVVNEYAAIIDNKMKSENIIKAEWNLARQKTYNIDSTLTKAEFFRKKENNTFEYKYDDNNRLQSIQWNFGDQPINKIVYERNSDGFLKSKTILPFLINKNKFDEATQKWLIEYDFYEK